MKTYFKTGMNSGLFWHTTLGDKHLTLRFAWRPSFLLEKYIDKHGLEEWQSRYQEMLELLKEVWDNWKSPFVIYSNELNS